MPKKILYIDDNKNQLKLVKKYIEQQLDYAVDICNDPEEIQKLNFENYDLLLTDMMMPNKDGMELLKEIRSTNTELPVIMITAHSTANLVVHFMKAGGTDYLEKPLDLELLCLKINRALRDSELAKQIRKNEINNLINIESNYYKQEIILAVFNGIFNQLHSIISFSKKGVDKFSMLSEEIKFNYFNIILNGGQSILDKLRYVSTSFENDRIKVLEKNEIEALALIKKSISEIDGYVIHKIKKNKFEDFIFLSNAHSLEFVLKFLLLIVHKYASKDQIIYVDAIKSTNIIFTIKYKGLCNYKYSTISYREFSPQETHLTFLDFTNDLNICSRILQNLNGKINVDQTENENSQIQISLEGKF